MGFMEMMNKPWHSYPFFQQPDLQEKYRELKESLENGQITLGQFRQTIFYRETTHPVSSSFTPSAHPMTDEAAFSDAVKVLQNQKNTKNSNYRVLYSKVVTEFAANYLEYTGNDKDFLILKELYTLFLNRIGTQISQKIFTWNLKKALPNAIRKQKNIDGYPILVFFRVRLKGADPTPDK